MENLCFILVKKLVYLSNLSKDDDDIEVYVYGLLTFLYTLLPLIVLLIIALLFGKLCEMLSWVIAFLYLRKYAGGYHAKTPTNCFISSILLGITSLFVCVNIPFVSIEIYINGIVINYVILALLSPATNKNFKPQIQFQCKIKITLLMLIFSIFGSFLPDFRPYHLCVLVYTSLLCIAQKILK